MFGSGVLDTAIGLIFVFLLVSLLVTIINEMIAGILLSRAKWLRIGIEHLLGADWMKRLYAHPLIEGSSASAIPAATGSIRGSGPSYLASRTFANVLLDLVREGDETLADARRALQDALDAASASSATTDDLKRTIAGAAAGLRPPAGTVSAVTTDLATLLAAIPATRDDIAPWLDELETKAGRLVDPQLLATRDALTGLVSDGRKGTVAIDTVGPRLQLVIDAMPYVAIADQIKKDLGALMLRIRPGYTVGDAATAVQRFIDGMPSRYLREVVERLPDPRMRKTLLVLLDDAEDDVERFKQNVEIWFNNAMDRVGGWYKRRSQVVIAAVSVVCVVALNVDTLLIVNHLETHPGVRDALVAQAKDYAETNPVAPPIVVGSGETSTTGTATPRGVALPDQFGTIETRLSQLGLPIGWVRSDPSPSDQQNRLAWPGARGAYDTVTFHLLGWLITAIAATMGAPFWFDLLNRVISIRSAGKSPQEQPKPPRNVPAPLEPGQSPAEADAVAALAASRGR